MPEEKQTRKFVKVRENTTLIEKSRTNLHSDDCVDEKEKNNEQCDVRQGLNKYFLAMKRKRPLGRKRSAT